MKDNNISQIQGLRGLAILGIFIFHTQTFLSEVIRNQYSFIIQQLGTIGVIIFFILSGFLLTYKNKIIPNLPWKNRITECRAKFHKLYFIYILTLFIAFLGKSNIPQNLSDWIYTIISLPFNLTYTQDLIPLTRINISFNGPAWYISAMFIIWIITYSFSTSINTINSFTPPKCLVGILVIIGIQSIYKILEFYFPIHLIPINHPDIYMSWISYFSPFYNFGFFILGCFIGRLALLQKAELTITIYKYLILILTLGLLFFIYDKTHFEYYKPILIEIFIGILLLIVISPNSYLGYIFSLKPLVWIGDLSSCIF